MAKTVSEEIISLLLHFREGYVKHNNEQNKKDAQDECGWSLLSQTQTHRT
jgi:hypothetical protein